MRFCAECGSKIGNAIQACTGCDSRIDEYYTRPLSDKTKRKNILKARSSYCKGDYGASVRLLSEIGIKEPKNINILFSLGRSLANTKDYSRAMQVYDRALNIKPDSVNILFAKGLCFMELGDFKEAKKYFVRSLELEPMFKNGRQMMKQCEDKLTREHDDIVHKQMKDIFKSRPKREAVMEEEVVEKIDEPAATSDVGEIYRCRACGSYPHFEDQYQMWWCDGCSRYVPEEMLEEDEGVSMEDVSVHPCRSCGNILRFIEEYGKWWCDPCGKYEGDEDEAPLGSFLSDEFSALEAARNRSGRDTAPETGPRITQESPSCESCRSNMRFIDAYQMWWCDRCEKYLGEDVGGAHADGPDVSSSTPGRDRAGMERSPREREGRYDEGREAQYHLEEGYGQASPAPDMPQYPCRKCGTLLKFIDQYEKWWCDGCYEYV